MKFINYLDSITNIGVYPLTSLLIFFLFFIGVGVYIVKGRKEYFETLSHLPLNSEENEVLTQKTHEYVTKIK